MLSRCALLSWVTQKDCERKRKREVWGWGSLWRRWQRDHYCSSKFPSSPHPSPYMHILIKSSPQCLYVWQLGCLSILFSYSHHELLSQACSQIHLLYCSVCHQLSVTFFFLCLKDCLLEQGMMSDKFSAYVQHAMHSLKCHRTSKVGGTNSLQPKKEYSFKMLWTGHMYWFKILLVEY